MSKVSLMAKLTAHEGKGDELAAAFDGLFAHVETEPGTEVYVLSRVADDPDAFFFFELYVDDDAFAAHGTSDAMKAAGASFGPLIKDSELLVGSPIRGIGLAV